MIEQFLLPGISPAAQGKTADGHEQKKSFHIKPSIDRIEPGLSKICFDAGIFQN